ncbi:MAG: DUF5331 domain-containing protein [Cyanobacteria bacterium P01_A01_bin.105]
MNVDQFRRSLKVKWLAYYRENREWLDQLGIWVTDREQRRPTSSFILATLAILEPRLSQMMPLVVNLNTDPDRILVSLGLNFDPAQELKRLSTAPQQLPASDRPKLSVQDLSVQAKPVVQAKPIIQKDEECTGIRRRDVAKVPVESR